ncbi:Do family serine endopeptidase [Candidatus Methylacidiphilum infernorum]|uniref:Do family serine endopeptidase n=1 Tax=Candidatus Methylacidiphilum infernorum TaxID=511746 RepID=A0ABX7PWH0_9BACT|nr:Do family serine endopeptidase [Candidatus Methylacidiphilum infernorum]QSR87003.1 Do family serine endopeptidase [Candidatus Methylacidiphilum infernorum]
MVFMFWGTKNKDFILTLSGLIIAGLIGLLIGLSALFFIKPAAPKTTQPTPVEIPVARALPVHPAEIGVFRHNLLETLNEEYVKVISQALPAVVNIFSARPVEGSVDLEEGNQKETKQKRKSWKKSPIDEETSLGSGIILSSDGNILTNAHLVKNAREIRVQLFDGRRYEAKLLGIDSPTDVAVLKIAAQHLSILQWGDSDALQVGEQVFAVGNPFGLAGSVSRGIVSAKGRNPTLSSTSYEDFIQTDAAINPGNSGGALINVKGELVGINTAIYSGNGGSNGIGFAIPSKLAKFAYVSLLEKGKVVRGFLGVETQEVDEDLQQIFGLPNSEGALITKIEPRSPASKAGLQRGDIIVRYNDMPVKDPAELRISVSQSPAGSKVPIVFYREGQRHQVFVEITEQPDNMNTPSPDESGGNPSWKVTVTGDLQNVFGGLHVVDLDPILRSRLSLSPRATGIYLVDVEGGYPAFDVLYPGDVIEEIRRPGSAPIKIHSVGEFLKLIKEIPATENVAVFLQRGNNQMFVLLKP